MKTKLKIIILVLICSGLLLGFAIWGNSNKPSTPSKPQNKAKPTGQACYPEKFASLDVLKNKADIIVKAQGTSKYKLKDYGGIEMRISTLTVLEVIKGDKALKEINLIQTEGLDTEKPPVNGEILLLFLNKCSDLKDTYMPMGGSQGTYDIVSTSKTTSDENTEIKPNSMVNEDVLKDLNGSYSDIKKKIAQ